jgi:hypothetical protein
MRLLLTTIVVASAACGPAPLANPHESADRLARALLSAVQRGDRVGLQDLALNEHEFKAHIWPSLPASRPERNLPFSYVWGDLHQKSETSLTAMLATYGGRQFELVELSFAEPPQDYAAFRIHREPVFVVRESGRPPERLRLCGSLLEKGGAWKVFSYVADD